jgi:hypothetical protein
MPIQDPDNIYWQAPNSTNDTPVQGPPPPAPAPPDDSGSGHEASYEPPAPDYNQAVADSIAAQYGPPEPAPAPAAPQVQDDSNPYWQAPNATTPPPPMQGPAFPSPDASGREASFENLAPTPTWQGINFFPDTGPSFQTSQQRIQDYADQLQKQMNAALRGGDMDVYRELRGLGQQLGDALTMNPNVPGSPLYNPYQAVDLETKYLQNRDQYAPQMVAQAMQRIYWQQQQAPLARYGQDPDAQAYFGTEGAGAYGPAPDPSLLGQGIRSFADIMHQHLGQGLQAAAFGVGLGPELAAYQGSPTVRMDVKRGLQLGQDILTVPSQKTWQGETYLSAGIRQALTDLGLSDGTIEQVFQSMGPAGLLPLLATKHFKPSDQDAGIARYLDAGRQTYDAQTGWQRTVGETVVDPWNLLGTHAAVAAGKTALAKLVGDVALGDTLTPELLHWVTSPDTNLSRQNWLDLLFAKSDLSKTLTRAAGQRIDLGGSKLADAFATELTVERLQRIMQGGDTATAWTDVVQRLPGIAERVGASDADVRFLLARTNQPEVQRRVEQQLADWTTRVTRTTPGLPATIEARQTYDQSGKLIRLPGPTPDLIALGPGEQPLLARTTTPQEGLVAHAQQVEVAAQDVIPPAAVTPENAPQVLGKQPAIDNRLTSPVTQALVPKAEPVTKAQYATLQNMRRAGELSPQQATDLAAGAVTKAEANHIIAHQRGVSVWGALDAGYDVPLVTQSEVDTAAVVAAYDDQRVRGEMLPILRDAFPELSEHPGASKPATPYFQAFGRANPAAKADTMAGVVSRMAPSELRDWAYVHLADFEGTPFETPLRRIIQYGTYVAQDGTISSSTARWAFQDAVGELLATASHGSTDLEDVRRLYRKVNEFYTGNRVTDAMLDQAAQARVARLGPKFEQQIAPHLADLKARNADLLTQLKGVTGPDKGPLLRELGKNSTEIRLYEPRYEPAAAKLSATERVAQRDAALGAQGLADVPSSDPVGGFAPDPAQRAVDANNDWIAEIVNNPPQPAPAPRVLLDPNFDSRAFLREKVAAELPSTEAELRASIQRTAGDIAFYQGKKRLSMNQTIALAEARERLSVAGEKLAALGAAPERVTIPEAAVKVRKAAPPRDPVAAADTWLKKRSTGADWMRRAVAEGRPLSDIPTRTLASMSNLGTTPEAVVDAIRREGGLADAAGGGLGIVHPGARAYVASGMARDVPVVDPLVAAWRQVNFADPEVGRLYDQVVARQYRFQDYADPLGIHLKGGKLVKSGSLRQSLDPRTIGALQKQSYITKATDNVLNSLMPIMDEAYGLGGLHGMDSGEYFNAQLKWLGDATTTPAEIATRYPQFTTSKELAESLRTYRKYAPDLIASAEAGRYSPYISLGWFEGLAPRTVDGAVPSTSMQALDDLFSGRAKTAAGIDKQMAATLRDAAGPQWQAVKSQYFDAGTRRWRAVSLDQLDSLLFPGVERPTDLKRVSELMAGDLGQLIARDIGFEHSDVPWDLRLMGVIKGNLAPFWMTDNPGYHIRNVVGNIISQIIAFLRSDMHVGLNPLDRRLARVAAAQERAGSGVRLGRYFEAGFGAERSESKYVITSRGALNPAKLGAKGGDVMEDFGRKVIGNQEWEWTYTDRWRKGLETNPAIDAHLDPARARQVRDELLQAVGLDEISAITWNLPGAVREAALAEQRSAIAYADMAAYRTTSTALRDYRLRTRGDGWLDRVFPVHFWTTRNLMFVGGTAIDRPSAAVAATKVLSQWEQSNQDLPFSQKMGLVKLPGELMQHLPYLGTVPGQDFYWRVNQYINPAAFAIPQLLRELGKGWGATDQSNMSLAERIKAFAAPGLANFYRAMGYIPGPQWDLASRAAGAAALHFDGDSRWDRLVQQVDRVGRAVLMPDGYSSNLIPYQSLAESSSTKLPLINRSLQQLFETFNQRSYGTPYTRKEMAQMGYAAADQFQQGAITEAQYWVIMKALSDRQFDAPSDTYVDDLMRHPGLGLSRDDVVQTLKLVRPLVDQVQNQSAVGFIRSVMLGLGGSVDTPEMRAERATNQKYWAIKGLDQLKGYQALGGVDMGLLKQFIIGEDQYQQIKAQYGAVTAGRWMHTTAPWLVGYWNAYDDTAKVQQQLVDRDNRWVNDQRKAGAVLWWNDIHAKQDTAAPFYTRLDQVNEAYWKAVGRANGNLVLIDLADKNRDQMRAEINDDATAAGVDLYPDNFYLPKQSSTWSKTFQHLVESQPRIAEAVVALQDRDQAQRGKILEQVERIMGVNQYMADGTYNPRFVNDQGEFDYDAWHQAIQDTKGQAPSIYRDFVEHLTSGDALLREGVDARRATLHLGVVASNITPDDFVYALTGDKTQTDKLTREFREQRQRDKDAIFALFNDPNATSDAKDQAVANFKAVYHQDPTAKTYHDAGGFTALQNAQYGEGLRALQDAYYTNLTPREQAEFRERNPDAFTSVEKTGTDADGSTYTYQGQDFNPKAMTGQQITDELGRIGRDPFGRPAGASNDVERGGTGAQGNTATEHFTAAEVEDIHARKAERDALPEVATYYQLLDHGKATMIDFNGQQLSLADAAEQVMSSDAAKTKQGYASYILAAKSVGEDSDLGQYLLARKQAGADRKQAVADWWNGLTEAERTTLSHEDPDTFGAGGLPGSTGPLADTTGGTPSSAGPTSSSPYVPFTRTSGSSYRSRSGGGSSYAARSSSGYVPRTTGVGSSSGSSLVGALWQLDPVLSTGQDDGRGQLVTQVGSAMSQFLSLMQPAYAALGGKGQSWYTMAQDALLGWVRLLLQHDPSAATWQTLLDYFSKYLPQQADERRRAIIQPAASPGPGVAGGSTTSLLGY